MRQYQELKSRPHKEIYGGDAVLLLEAALARIVRAWVPADGKPRPLMDLNCLGSHAKRLAHNGARNKHSISQLCPR